MITLLVVVYSLLVIVLLWNSSLSKTFIIIIVISSALKIRLIKFVFYEFSEGYFVFHKTEKYDLGQYYIYGCLIR